MNRLTMCLAAGATLATSAAGPAIADDGLSALRILDTFVNQIERGHRYAAPRWRDDDDDDGHHRGGYVRGHRYDDDDDDGGRGRGRAWNDDDD